MKDEEALELCERLRQLIKAGPGINRSAQQQLDLILAYVAHEFVPGSAVHDRILQLRDRFELWFDPRKLIAPHADAIEAMQLIQVAIDGLERALGNSGLPAEGGHPAGAVRMMA